jgi:hypothetical protein
LTSLYTASTMLQMLRIDATGRCVRETLLPYGGGEHASSRIFVFGSLSRLRTSGRIIR